MAWTRNDREIWYLAAVFLVSLALSLLSAIMLEPIPVQSGFLLLVLLPILPHLPAYVYGVYIREVQTPAAPGYQLALAVSTLISLYVNSYVIILLTGLPPLPPVWYHDVTVVVFVLLIPTYHMYIEYNDHGDFIQVVLLFIVYAPWAQFIRLFTGYMRFV